MNHIEAPRESDSQSGLFIAGGITGCPNWQTELIDRLDGHYVTVFNPRRKHFPMDDPTEAKRQIEWEYKYLRQALAISFWFPKETQAPITLYELGAWSMTNKPLFVGVHPDYARRQDVEIQTALVRPDVKIVYSIRDLAAQIREVFSARQFG